MGYLILFLLFALCFSGFVLFAKTCLKSRTDSFENRATVSVIIPARNEEKNLPYILDSLGKQTYPPNEIIVVDDFSADRTSEIAASYGVTVIHNEELPVGWTGKTWAVWNGYKHSTGDILVFLDADVRLAPNALNSLLLARESSGGVISAVPFHQTEKFYERLALITNILGIFSFTSSFERKNSVKGLYGSCIVASRSDYEKVGGHDSIRSELLDDLNLGKKFSKAGIKVVNFIGCDLVSFRMYPQGLSSEIQGFGKGAILSAATLRPETILFVVLWIVGLIVSGVAAPVLLIVNPLASLPFVAGYILYFLQILYFDRVVGSFGFLMPLAHVVSSLFFVYIVLFSVYQVSCLGYVSWKGRHIEVGDRK